MGNNPRCLYENSFPVFLNDSEMSILGALCDNYHGDARTTTRDAWKDEIPLPDKIDTSTLCTQHAPKMRLGSLSLGSNPETIAHCAMVR